MALRDRLPPTLRYLGVDRRHRLARRWSNRELRRIAPLLSGEVVNVSAGDNVDKEGGTYDRYFTAASSFSVTNWGDGAFRGFRGREGEIRLDLVGELPPALRGRFDVVFNHTTLEHVFDVRRAFSNLCAMSRDAVVLVVPFSQVHHENQGYQDYWRFTPTALRELFRLEGMAVAYESANDDFNASVYLFFVAVREPERWRSVLPSSTRERLVGRRIGRRGPGKALASLPARTLRRLGGARLRSSAG